MKFSINYYVSAIVLLQKESMFVDSIRHNFFSNFNCDNLTLESDNFCQNYLGAFGN